MPRIHVLTNKNQADPQRLAHAVAIVVDVIFATTGIAILLERGAADVVPFSDPGSARAYARALTPGTFLLAGEQDGEAIPGFAEPWPCALLHADVAGKRIVYSTTNGTVALRRSTAAGLVLAGAPLNARAVANYACAHHGGRDIILICAGSGPGFSLEDFYGAGCLASYLAASQAAFQLSDAAKAARLLFDHAPPAECVEDTYAGRMMAAQGRLEDLRLCSQLGIFHTVPVFADNRITRA